MCKKEKNNKGQVLVTVLVFMVISIIITTAAITLTIKNATSTSSYTLGDNALSIAESGADNAILQLIRNPSYTGETLSIGTGSVIITVTGSNPITITSEGTYNSHTRKIQVVGTLVNTVFTITTWNEVN